MALDYEKFMMKQTEWRGEVTNKLENINKVVDEAKLDNKIFSAEVRKELALIRKQIANTNIRVAGIAGTISIIVAVGTALIIYGLG